MALGLVGKKIGMTRVFAQDGGVAPVTVIEVTANRVTQVKTKDKDGYAAVQVTTGDRRADRVGKALAGHFAKAGVAPGRGLWEFRLADGEGADLKPGSEVKVDLFKAGQQVDVQGTSIGKGSPVSSSAIISVAVARPTVTRCRIARRVLSASARRRAACFRARRWPVTWDTITATSLNLEVVQVDAERNLLLVKGAVPGPKGQDVVIRPSVKARGRKAQAAKK